MIRRLATLFLFGIARSASHVINLCDYLTTRWLDTDKPDARSRSVIEPVRRMAPFTMPRDCMPCRGSEARNWP